MGAAPGPNISSEKSLRCRAAAVGDPLQPKKWNVEKTRFND